MERDVTEPAGGQSSWAARRPLLIGLAAAYFVALGIFAYVASDIHRFPGELGFSLWIQSWRASWLDGLMQFISVPGFRAITVPIIALTAAFLYLKG